MNKLTKILSSTMLMLTAATPIVTLASSVGGEKLSIVENITEQMPKKELIEYKESIRNELIAQYGKGASVCFSKIEEQDFGVYFEAKVTLKNGDIVNCGGLIYFPTLEDIKDGIYFNLQNEFGEDAEISINEVEKIRHGLYYKVLVIFEDGKTLERNHLSKTMVNYIVDELKKEFGEKTQINILNTEKSGNDIYFESTIKFENGKDLAHSGTYRISSEKIENFIGKKLTKEYDEKFQLKVPEYVEILDGIFYSATIKLEDGHTITKSGVYYN